MMRWNRRFYKNRFKASKAIGPLRNPGVSVRELVSSMLEAERGTSLPML